MDNVIKRLENVPNIYKPMPFWSWNGKIEKGELLRQIDDMQEKGFGGFVIHARAGLATPYMGEEWFACVKECILEAKKRGMYVWLYDENGWPSGFAGGKLLSNDNFLVSGVRQDESEEWDETATAIFVIKDGKAERVFAPVSGKKYVRVYTYKNHSYVDLCNPRVTDAFIEETHEKYYRAFSEFFGNTVLGFFTDEPQWYRSGTPYSDMLCSYFQEKYGEDVIDKLPLLFYDLEGAKEFRFRYYSALNEMIRDHYFRKIYDWCEAHRCMLTGHAIDERSFCGQMVCSGNVMPFYEFMQQPGMDFLGRFSSGLRIAKQVYSVAKQTGRKRIMTETFAMTGWDVTFDELRWIIDSQFVGGANSVCPHLYPYAFESVTRYDHPCMFSECDPWWEQFGKFNDYCSRISYLLSESEEEANVALLHTVKSAYLKWNLKEGGKSIVEEERGTEEAFAALFSRGVPFDVVDESLLFSKGKVENGALVVGNCRYSYLVIPYCTALNGETVEKIERFIREGGRVFVQKEMPIRLDGTERTVTISSNIEWKELLQNSGAILDEPKDMLAVTKRKTKDGKQFMFVVNRNKEKTEKAAIRVPDTASCSILDMVSLQKTGVKRSGNTVSLCLAPSSSVILLIDEKENSVQERGEFSLLQEGDPSYLFPKENYFILEEAEWSLDGKGYFTRQNIQGVQAELLQRRYNGTLYLRHNFKVKALPEKLVVRWEYKANALFVNGKSVKIEEAKNGFFARIENCLQEGENEIVVETEFYQRPYVYEVLFGKDTTESLLNCLRYDTWLTELSFAGDIAVSAGKIERVGKTYRAEEFTIAKSEEKKLSGNVIENGLPFYRGKLTYLIEIEGEEGEHRIELCGRFATAKISVNGGREEDILFGNHAYVDLKTGKNELRVTIYSGNRNYHGPFHLKAEDFLVSPDLFMGRKGEYTAEEYDKDGYYFAPFGLEKWRILRRDKKCCE